MLYQPLSRMQFLVSCVVLAVVSVYFTAVDITPQQKKVAKTKYEYVISQLDKRHLPHIIAIVPLVESEYNCKARSRVGAAGCWQLMPELAKDYKLKKADRYNLYKSTPAAINYLCDLYNEFGSWPLAFAAYNCGDGRVTKAIHKYHSHNYVKLHLPFETVAYVKQIYKNEWFFQHRH
jgi:membrane-bound lytic murein transglycosylase MltF